MATNNFKAFATANGANVTAQSDYEALTALLTGFQSGKASSAQINKAIRQSSTIAAVVAQYIANNSGNDVLDNGDTAGILANLILAIQSSVKGTAIPLLTGVTGEARNVRMSITAASATATITADEVIVSTGLGGNQYRVANVNKTINIGTAGLGGMNTGSAPNPGFVAIYLVYNPTTGDSALVAVNATSSKAPESFGVFSQFPAYTASALLSVWRCYSGTLAVGEQFGRSIYTADLTLVALSGNVSSLTVLNISPYIPLNAKVWNGYGLINGTSSAVNNNFTISGTSGSVGIVAIGTGNSGNLSSFADVPIPVPQTTYYLMQTSGTFSNGSIHTTGYKI